MDAGAFLRARRIVLDTALRRVPLKLQRVLVHELFHFVWWRLGSPRRREWEALIVAESSRGEAGWSSEWRKRVLVGTDRRTRSRRWREYLCESFCDSASVFYAGTSQDQEITLAPRWLKIRRRWFEDALGAGPLSI